nr:metallophosphoesterase [Pseudodesulfovibrio sp.]
MKKILICGDIHGDFQVLNWLCETQQPNQIIQVGDFGYWPRLPDHGWPPENPSLHNEGVVIRWIDGNHEDHYSLSKIAATGNTEVLPNVYYQPRGSVLALPNGQNILFFGGASSGDQWRRIEGLDWFQNEIPSAADIAKIPDDIEIDIVISHTAPQSFKLREGPPPKGYASAPWLAKHSEKTRQILDTILHRYKPKHWYFGHFHMHQIGQYEETGTKWTALAMPMEDGEQWWAELGD